MEAASGSGLALVVGSIVRPNNQGGNDLHARGSRFPACSPAEDTGIGRRGEP
jgi:hypothetical protein